MDKITLNQLRQTFINRHPGFVTGPFVRLAASDDGCGMNPETPAEGETVLLVEDETAILNLVTIMLEMQGYKVFIAATPGEALRLAEAHTGDIDLLITDVVMPEMNGRSLAERLQGRYPNLKTLFMSGYTADAIVHRGVLMQGVHFLQKPFTHTDLEHKVRQAIGKEEENR